MCRYRLISQFERPESAGCRGHVTVVGFQSLLPKVGQFEAAWQNVKFERPLKTLNFCISRLCLEVFWRHDHPSRAFWRSRWTYHGHPCFQLLENSH